jgi:steroid 5-alpha reductase family enzyme
LQKNNFKNDPKAPIFFTGKKPETLGGKILVSGLWGLLRKPNYIGDWIIAIALSLPTGFDHIFVRYLPGCRCCRWFDRLLLNQPVV